MRKGFSTATLLSLIIWSSWSPPAFAGDGARPTLWQFFEDLPVRLAKDGSASFTGEAVVTFRADGWLAIEFPEKASESSTQKVSSNDFAIQLPDVQGKVLSNRSGTTVIDSGSSEGAAAFTFDGSTAEKAMTGCLTLRYVPDSGDLHISINGGSDGFEGMLNIAMPADPIPGGSSCRCQYQNPGSPHYCTASQDNCPPGTVAKCTCNSGGCSSTCIPIRVVGR